MTSLGQVEGKSCHTQGAQSEKIAQPTDPPKYLIIPHITKTHTRKKKPATRSSHPKSNLTKHQNKHKNQTNINIIEGGGANTRERAKARTLHIFRVVCGKLRFRLAETVTR
ncbi:unnamed protein product [Prunus armeniaca]